MKKILAVISAMALAVSALTSFQIASAAEVTIDGKVSEWKGVEMQTSTNTNIEKWAVMQDDKYVYFYVQQNGGNEWGLPITNTYVDISYASGQGGRNTQIRFVNMLKEFKDAWYGDIDGAIGAYEPSKEANKYEIEFAIPQTFFVDDDYTIKYCGATVKSSDIKNLKEVATPEPTEAVYQGVTIDGTFIDWDAVARTDVNDASLEEVATVFDGDYFYIYIKEKSVGSATSAGDKSNGKYTIYTDLGRNTTFKLNKNSIDGIEGAKVSYSNKQYEIAIPASAIKQYKDTISFGYYMSEDMFVKDIANLKENDSKDKSFHGIKYDGNYTDWDYYPHQLVQYSTSGGVGEDAEAALYLDGTTLYGHVLSTLHKNEREFHPFTIRVNEEEKTSINFRLVAVDKDGKINMNPKLEGLDAGTYEFYLWDRDSGSTASSINDKDAPIYGQMKLTVRQTADGVSISDEMEYKVNLEKLAEHFDMDASDMKMIQAQYINIGQEWVTIAGTSTGAAMGISLCVLSVGAVMFYRKRRSKVKTA